MARRWGVSPGGPHWLVHGTEAALLVPDNPPPQPFETPMKITLAALTALVAVSAFPLVAQAEDAPSTTFNIGAVTDYRYPFLGAEPAEDLNRDKGL